MGFSGQLGTVNLADIFQTLHMNRQGGTLTVAGPAETVRIWFSEGQIVICSAQPVDSRPYVLHAALKKGLVSSEIGEDLLRRHRQTGQPMRELLLNAGAIAEPDLDELSAWCIEEQVCPTFEWTTGEFSFEEGGPAAELQGSDLVQMGATGLQTTQVVMEATRRKDEWRRIREVISDPDALYQVDNEGRNNLRSLQTDPEMLKVLRYLDGQHTLEAIAQAVGITRFDTYAIVAQLVLGNVARARGPAEIVEDALALKAAGEPAKARELLENAARAAQVPEVLRPLAEVCAELNQVPRAVELYLTLIQQAQDAGDLPQALAHLDTVIGLSPDDPDLQFERAQVHGELGNVEPAAQGFVAAAQAYITTKDVQKAVDACHRAKNLLPRSPDPHRYLARAYLLDGNTETAVVEYKALWHALLSQHRPRRALEELTQILDGDCKYAAVKEQVLSHAQNSEAVKTSRAIRTLVNVSLGLVVAGGLFAGYIYYDRVMLREEGRRVVQALTDALPKRKDALEHRAVNDQIAQLRTEYGIKVPELDEQLVRIAGDVRTDFESRAQACLERAAALRKAGDYAGCRAALDELAGRFEGTLAAASVQTARTTLRSDEIGTQVTAKALLAQRRWDAWAWDEALSELAPILARSDLPTEIRNELTARQVEWQAALGSAKELSRRAEAIAKTGDQAGAMAAWRRASDPAASGDGERGNALNRLVALERESANEWARKAQGAATRGDAAGCFAAIDQLNLLLRDARGSGPREVVSVLSIPFAIEVDSRHTVLALQRPGAPVESVRAPGPEAAHGQAAGWRHIVQWHIAENVQVSATRGGFATQTFTITPAARRVTAQVSLVRGPRSRVDLGASPSSAPVAVGSSALIGTNRATLEVVDCNQGVTRPIGFPDSVAELSTPPVVFGTRAYVALDDRIHAIELSGRTRLWTWPENVAPADRKRLTGALAVQEHELIQGQLLVFAAAARGEILALAIDPAGRVLPYPGLRLDSEITGSLLADRSALFIPAGPTLHAYDLTAVTERSPPARLFSVRTRGDLTGLPRPAVIGGVPSLLVADATGQIIAIDRRPGTPDGKRVIGSWSLDGTAPGTPSVAPDGALAWVVLAEGRVQCLDLAKPGTPRWRAPAKGTSMGNLIGQATLGRRGLYVADANGLLHCLDPLTGAPRWKADLGGSAAGGALAMDGRIIVPIANGQVVIFDEGEE